MSTASLGLPTVAALSTPPGRGGVALLRVSGEQACDVVARVFRPRCGAPLLSLPPRIAVYGDFFDEGGVFDEGLATFFRAPRSYTGEDVVELTCHGGVLVTQKALAALLAAGAESAPPGEFTRRAYLSGKIGLSAAEALADLYDAESDEALRLAASGAAGDLSREISRLSEALTNLLASAYVTGDYPEEDLAPLTANEMSSGIADLLSSLDELIAGYRVGHALAEGVRAVIVGAPNAGKSSLFNALLGRDRAIVSSSPGTTRDAVDATLLLGGAKLLLTDTAGVRTCPHMDDAERQGVARTLAAIERAEILLYALDGSSPRDPAAEEPLTQAVRARASAGAKLFLVRTKCDLPMSPRFAPPVFPAVGASRADLPGSPEGEEIAPPMFALSAASGEGVEALRSALAEELTGGNAALSRGVPIVSSARQAAALRRSREALSRAREALSEGMTPDIAGLDLEVALAALLETDGRGTLDHVVDAIFRRFCVGK